MQRRGLIKIGELASLTGAHVKSLRYYERIGALKPVHVDEATGYRYYAPSQVGLVTAILTCVELGIPLSQFPQFALDSGRGVDYARLVAHGRAVAQRKMRAIEQGLQLIDEMHAEIERTGSYSEDTAGHVFDMPRRDYWVELYDGDPSSADYYAALSRLFSHVEAAGLKFGYDFGVLRRYCSGEVARYAFMDVLLGEGAPPPNRVLCVPAGAYHCVKTRRCDADSAPALFGALRSAPCDSTVIVTEVFSGHCDLENPVYEWRCPLPPDGLK